ncbi:MAG: T9SS type A sorting domain-containing protein [Chlorobi bacterium]|nr:T9SS type A sorting domain-containing protein [Chlorobiota bacterium]MCI0714693.1 T9SS type A sorting domain-containing protein [Chlorobiota bacterium]
MKTFYRFSVKKSAAFLILMLTFTVSSLAQLPQYYNYNNVGSSSNTFPFGQTAGKAVNWLFLANDFNQPSPAPGGYITKVYFFITTGGTRTFTNLHILMAQSSITTLTTGTFYPGPWDTVYFNPSVSLTGPTNGWMSVTLDRPYQYNPAQSLVIFVGQCGSSGSGVYVRQNVLANTRRVWSVGGCPFVATSGDGSTLNFGFDLVPNCSFTWGPQTSGTTQLLYSVKAVNDLVAWAAGNAATVRRTTNGGTTWTDGNPNPGVINGAIYNIEAIDANTAWCTTSPSNTFIYKTTNGGTNWVQVYTAAGFINAIKMTSPTVGIATGDPVGGNWVILGTTDGGSTWSSISTTPGTGDGRNNCLQVMLPHVWFGSGQGTIWHSTNAGVNWTSVATTGLAGQVLAVHFNSLTLGLGGGATMVKSTNAGGNYALLPALGTGNITGIQGAANDFWYCRGTGIYRSTNGGTNWTQVHTAVGTQNDLSLAFGGNGCFVGWSVGSGGNIAKMNGMPVGIGNNNNEIPSVYRLEQNYPNPFNPATIISFSLPKSGFVELRVYDILGREVAVLVNEVRQAGSHSIDFNASSLASGIYLYTIKSGDFTDTKKMALIK